MRYVKPLMAIFMVTLITSCSWWPFGGGRDTGNCLDDDSCEGANPFEEQLVGGTWYCYGVTPDDPWDCSQEEDNAKAVAVSETPPEADPAVEEELAIVESVSLNRAEMNNLREEISSQRQSAPSPVAANNFLDGFGDDAWAVQLIALQSRDEVDGFVAKHEISEPKYVQIESGGANWYVLILDVFNDRAAADSAAQAWETENEPSSRPWVRAVRSLKAAANRAES